MLIFVFTSFLFDVSNIQQCHSNATELAIGRITAESKGNNRNVISMQS